jgi:hypothetical protein
MLDDPDGAELYNILLGNIEHRSAELGSIKVENYNQEVNHDYRDKNL